MKKVITNSLILNLATANWRAITTMNGAALMLVVATAITPSHSCAQSAFSAGEKESSLLFKEGGVLQYSFQDPTVSFAYAQTGRQDSSENGHKTFVLNQRIHFIPRYGVELKGRPGKEGASFTIFDKGVLASGASASLSYGWHNVFSFIPSRGDYVARAEDLPDLLILETKKNEAEAGYAKAASALMEADDQGNKEAVRKLRPAVEQAFVQKNAAQRQLEAAKRQVERAPGPTRIPKVREQFKTVLTEFSQAVSLFEKAPKELIKEDDIASAVAALRQGGQELEQAQRTLDQWPLIASRGGGAQDFVTAKGRLTRGASAVRSGPISPKQEQPNPTPQAIAQVKDVKEQLEKAAKQLEAGAQRMADAHDLLGAFQPPVRGPLGMTDDVVNVSFGYAYENVPLINAANQFSRRKTGGLTGAVTYNADFATATPFTLGLLIGRERTNNVRDLVEMELTEEIIIQDGNTTRTVTRTRKGFRDDQGIFREFNTWKANADLLFRPRFASNRLGLNLFARWRKGGGDAFFTPGVGAFLLKPGKPKQPVAGIILRRADDESGVRADLVASLNF
jgi:lipoprotein-anchoring transpeptidase ErfK/SrfK